MDYEVVITSKAQTYFEGFLSYLAVYLSNPYAAKRLLDDFSLTKEALSISAGSLALCENPKLSALGYRKIRFRHHRLSMLYRLLKNTAVVDAIFHDLQDYENKIN